MESVTTPLSYRCLLLVVVESVDFVHLDLNSKKALRLGISHIIHLAVRSDEVQMPCGITFLGLSFVEVNPSVWVAIVLPARQCFVHRCMLFMLASLIFAKRPRLQTRIFQINKDGDRVFVRLESILNFLCESNQLVFCGVVTSEAMM